MEPHYTASQPGENGCYDGNRYHESSSMMQLQQSPWNRTQEKKRLQEIHDRFESFSQKVAELRAAQGTIGKQEADAFLTTIHRLEENVSSMKNSYDKELDELRRELDSACAGKAEWAAMADRYKKAAAQLHAQLEAETDRIRKLTDEANGLHAFRGQLEQELMYLRTLTGKQHDSHEHLHASFHELQQEVENLNDRLESERRQRIHSEESAAQLQKKLKFQSTIAQQQSEQLQSRLEAAGGVIRDLEGRLTALTSSESHLPELLRRVREAAAEDLQRYKAETEQEFTYKITALNDKYADDARLANELKKENEGLNEVINELRGRINSLQAQMNGLAQERDGLSASIGEERRLHAEQIRLLQQRLEALNQSFINRMREVNLRDDVRLQPEMESLTVLLDEAEKEFHNAFGGVSVKTSYTGFQDGATGYRGAAGAAGRYGNYEAPSGGAPAEYANGGYQQCPQYPCTQIHSETDGHVVGPISKLSVASPRPEYSIRTQAQADMAKLEASTRQQPTGEYEQRPTSAASHGSCKSSSSHTGDLRIHEVHPSGQYVRLNNISDTKEVDIGGYKVLQNVGGRPVAVFSFPSKTTCGPSNTVTVWSADTDPSHHQPPTDFICRDQEKWGAGPETTTVVCNSKGQAVAWFTPPHRVTRDPYTQFNAGETVQTQASNVGTRKLSELPEKRQSDAIFLYRERMEPPGFPIKHPHTQSPGRQSHPHTNTARQKTMGNENSSFNRQTRWQYGQVVPDPVPERYCGASAHRLGSSPLKKPTIRGNGKLIKKQNGELHLGPPSPFLSGLLLDYSSNPGVAPRRLSGTLA